MHDTKIWFGRWEALHLLTEASIDTSVNEAFLQRQCITAWEEVGGSRLLHYISCIAPNYKTLFFSERGNRPQAYLLEPIPISAVRTIASICLSSHSLRCETGRWGAGEEANRLCSLCTRQVRESEAHTLLECLAFDHIQARFPITSTQIPTLQTLLSQPKLGLQVATLISTILTHRESLINSQNM